MQLTIELPDHLATQLQTIPNFNEFVAKLVTQSLSKNEPINHSSTDNVTNDPWSNPNIDLPSTDTGIADFAHQHDHYLYGTEKWN